MHEGINTPSLVVFSDDWGRHPSSCQHLIRQLLPRYRVVWVNTIGTRPPKLSWEDLSKVAVKLRQWVSRPQSGSGEALIGHENLTVITPRMWPGFRRGWQRRLNTRLIRRAVHGVFGPRHDRAKRVAITTLPITADLVGKLDVDRWVYYCVDDFSVWPGLDGSVMQDMERQQVGHVDQVLAVSQELAKRLSGMGRQAPLLTHGIDLDHWTCPDSSAPGPSKLPAGWEQLARPIILFWGLIDRRLDTTWCRTLVQGLGDGGSVVLVGPQQSPDPELAALDRLTMPGPVKYADLPAVAADADVLVMPYADLPVTRAMQPLKFKEYLATGKPVVVRNLPATQPWADAADVVDSAQAFVGRIRERAWGGTPRGQLHARRRLADESWEHKARLFETILREGL